MAELLRDMAKLKTAAASLEEVRFESPCTLTPEMKTAMKTSGLEDTGINLS